MPLRYQPSSAELPAAEYSTSAIGPVRCGRMTVPRESLMRLEDLLAGLEEVLLDADVRRRRGRAVAVVLVGARRPHEVPAVGVDVVHELDVRERVHDPRLVARLRLGVLARPSVGLVRAVGGRAGVPVEESSTRRCCGSCRRPSRRARGRVGVARHRAVVDGSVLRWTLLVVHRVVRAVRVGVRRDEHLDVVQQLLRLRVGGVVFDELVRRLQAGEARGPLASVLLAEQEDARLGAVTLACRCGTGAAGTGRARRSRER